MVKESRRNRSADITDAVLTIVDERGIDAVSVREVASGAGVSIGTVQHYFPTKDGMLGAAYVAVLTRLRRRLEAVERDGDVRRDVAKVLAELLPIDHQRVVETRVHLAFAARAATMPALAQIQRDALAEIHGALTEILLAAWGQGAANLEQAETAAHSAIALADGLALHAVSSQGWLSEQRQVEVIERTLDAILTHIEPAHD